MRSDRPILPCPGRTGTTSPRVPDVSVTGPTRGRRSPVPSGTNRSFPPNRTEPDVSPTRTSARRLVTVLLLSLVAVLAPVAGPATAGAAPVLASVGDDVVPSVSGPQSALPGRVAPGGPVPDDGGTPAGHPGPLLDALLLALPEVPATGPAGTAVEAGATAGLDPGHGSPTDARGPPAA